MVMRRKKTLRTESRESTRLKKGDTVMVISGSCKGQTGTILRVLLDSNKALVEGINQRTRCVKSNPMAGVEGGLVSIEMPLHLSNLVYVDVATSKPSHLRMVLVDDGGLIRKERQPVVLSSCSK
jgi:large subunit ribosomal protein L24